MCGNKTVGTKQKILYKSIGPACLYMEELDSTKRVRSINDNNCVDSWSALGVGFPF
jgi:hypothetical protein